uniref:Uncharacterized protein n=1 Tax=Anguilla anguilla TaxID=7936 RepID=A0A0E9WQL1_ANGAN
MSMHYVVNYSYYFPCEYGNVEYYKSLFIIFPLSSYSVFVDTALCYGNKRFMNHQFESWPSF